MADGEIQCLEKKRGKTIKEVVIKENKGGGDSLTARQKRAWKILAREGV